MIGLGYNSVDKVLDSQQSGSEFDSLEKPGVVATTCDPSPEGMETKEPLELAGQLA